MRIDHQLLHRLEAGAAACHLAVVRELRRADPGTPARAEPFGAGALVALGAGRYVNRAVGVSLVELADVDLDAVEAFYDRDGLEPTIELSSWAPDATVERLRARGYGPLWFRSMFAVRPERRPAPDPSFGGIEIASVTSSTTDAWREVLALGNGITDAAARAVSDEFATANRAVPGTTDLLATADGEVAGCASLQVVDGIGWLGGAATLPRFRGRGVQAALLAHRLDRCVAEGVELAAATALPSGTSARNLLRAGFLLVQTQLVTALSRPSREDPSRT